MEGVDEIGSFTLVRPHAGVGRATLKLGLIAEVAYLRRAMQTWTSLPMEQVGALVLFNWISVFNFNAGPDTHAFCIDSSEALLMGAGGQVIGPSKGAEALMFVKDGHVIRCDTARRQPLVYVSFLEVAPWNRSSVPLRLYPGLGPILLRTACDLSIQRGFGGRVGLHSIASAEDFYRRLGFRSLDCPSEYNEVYFELDESGAQALLSD